MKLRFALILAILTLITVPTFAQTPIAVGAAFSVQADCTTCATQNVSAFKWFLNGAQVGADQPVSAMVGTTITSPAFAGLAAGTYTVTVSAINPVAESAKSSALSLTAMNPPAAPTNLRIVGTTVVQVMPDGTATILSQTSTVEKIK